MGLFKKDNGRDAKLKSYVELALSGARNEELSEDLFNSLRDGDMDMARAIWDLGSRLDSNAYISLTALKIPVPRSQEFWKVPAHSHCIFEHDGSTGYARSYLADAKAPLMSPLSYFCMTDNLPAISFLLSKGVDINSGYDHADGKFNLRPIYHALTRPPAALTLLVAQGAEITENVMKKACLESVQRQDARVITICLEGGGDLKVAQDALAKLVASNAKLSESYVTDMTRVLKEYAEKKKAGAAVKPQTPVNTDGAQDPNEVILESTLMGRKLYKVFNFVSQECISVTRKGPEAPIESHETKRFCDLLGQPDLKKAFAEHQKRGGTMTEDDIETPAPSNKAPNRCVLSYGAKV